MVRHEDILEIDVAFNGIVIPTEHAIDSLLKLGGAVLVDATCVDPKVSQTIAQGLLTTELDLFVSKSVFARAIYEIFEADLFATPSVREYCVWRRITSKGNLN